MKIGKFVTSLLISAVLAVPLLLADIAPTLAGDPCESLWYQRNKIYAKAGYCFKTAKGIAAFGKGCFPPYGQLSPSQQKKVNWIKKQEAKLYCN